MPADTGSVEKVLGAVGTTFRLSRLYPPTHPAVQTSLRQVAATLPALAAQGTVEWKIGSTGLHWNGQHLLPRNTQLTELAGLLFARGIRGIQADPGVTAEHVLALFAVATGTLAPDDPSLGRLMLVQGRRSAQHQAVRTGADAPPAILTRSRAAAPVFRPDATPPDVESRRLIGALRAAVGAHAEEEWRQAAGRLLALAPSLVTARDVMPGAEVIAALDALLARDPAPELVDQIGAIGTVLADRTLVRRMVLRLGEARLPPSERAVLVVAVGALATVATDVLLEAFLTVPAELREPYRAAARAAADRAVEPLAARLADASPEAVAAAAELLGCTGAPQAVELLVPVVRHRAPAVRAAALHALAEIGGRDISRPAMPSLKDETVGVRLAAARAIGVAGDPGATTVLVRRLEQEEDEGVLAELLFAIGRLAAPEAINVLATYADPGGGGPRHTPHLRAAAIEALGYLRRPEARALLELYRQDKERTVARAAQAALQ
jgi:hypothetical protein